jgi:heparan-alpha-glucosaminide N-acetyltransferase
VLLMLFVNEMAGVAGTPAFLLHMPKGVDGMTLTDVVFPAFLFILGMSIPPALTGRLGRGPAPSTVWRHVLVRTTALLVLGVLMVNAERASPAGPLSPPLWNIVATLGAVLTWSAFATPTGEVAPRRSLRLLGTLILIAAVFLYRADGGSGLLQLRPHWWGILGLIGWAYLVAASLYLIVRDRPAALLGCVALLYCLYLADDAGRAAWLQHLRPVLHVGSVLGSHAAVVLSGTLLTVMLLEHQRAGGNKREFVRPALLYALGLAAAGSLLHSLHTLHRAFELSKIYATVPWCLISSAVTAAAWVAVFVLTDVRLRQVSTPSWPRIVTLAGENALVAYLLAPLALSLFELAAPLFGGVNPYHAISRPTWLGTLRSALFAWAIVRLCGSMRARGLHLRL